jgi:hypothetical protein
MINWEEEKKLYQDTVSKILWLKEDTKSFEEAATESLQFQEDNFWTYY